MKPASLVSCVVLCIACVFAGCDRSAPTPPPTPPSPSPTATPVIPKTSGRPQIAILPKDSSHNTELEAGISKALSEAKKGADGKPTVEALLNTDAGTQADRAAELFKSGVAVLVISPDSQQTLDTITTAAGRTPVVALDTTLNTDKCKTTINPDPGSPADYSAMAYTAIRTANELIREKKVDKQITTKPFAE